MIDIHSGNPGKTIILAVFLVSVIMVFISCNKVSTEGTADVQDTAFSMGTAITSTLYGRNREELEENIMIAKWAANKLVSEGKIPIAPHLYFPRFMDDSIAEERYFGMEAGKRLMMQCKEFLVVTVENVISEGMNEEIDYMTNRLMMQGKSINFTRLGLETVIHSRLER